MNTTIFWVIGGAAAAVFVYQVWRWFSRSLKRSIPPGEIYNLEDQPVATAVDEPKVVLDDAPAAMGIGDEEKFEEEAATETPASPEEEVLRMDVAVPPQVEVGRAFDLAVALRQMTAPLLAEDDLAKVASGPVAVTWEDAVERAVVRVQVIAPDCDIDVPEQSVTLTRHQDEPPVYFLLTPRRTGRISIQVKVSQQDLLLGNARIKTEAGEEVGQVKTEVTSYPLALTPNDRYLLRQNMIDLFDLAELHDVIFLLGLDRDNFPQEKDELIVDLVQTCWRQGLLRDLLVIGGQKRPFATWQLESLAGVTGT